MPHPPFRAARGIFLPKHRAVLVLSAQTSLAALYPTLPYSLPGAYFSINNRRSDRFEYVTFDFWVPSLSFRQAGLTFPGTSDISSTISHKQIAGFESRPPVFGRRDSMILERYAAQDPVYSKDSGSCESHALLLNEWDSFFAKNKRFIVYSTLDLRSVLSPDTVSSMDGTLFS